MNESTQNKTTYKTLILNHAWHSHIIGFLIGISMMVVYIWMAYGIISLLLGLYHAYPDNWFHGAEKMIKNTVLILALLELIRVFQSYLLLGRVKVTFILDVALVVLIGELISLWYAKHSVSEVILSIIVITVLIVLRIITTKFSPDCDEGK